MLHASLIIVNLFIATQEIHNCHNTLGLSGGVGGPALAGALFDGAININIELLMGATGPPHFTRHYALLRAYEISGSDCCATCAQLNQHQHKLFGQRCRWQTNFMCCVSHVITANATILLMNN